MVNKTLQCSIFGTKSDVVAYILRSGLKQQVFSKSNRVSDDFSSINNEALMSENPNDRPSRDPWTIIAALAVGGTVLTQLPIQWVHQHPYFSFFLVLPLYLIARELWIRLKPIWFDELAKKIDLFVRGSINGPIYRRKYLEYVRRQCRYVDVKGLSTQGPFALRLQNVFVQLLVKPEPPPDRGGPIPPLPPEMSSEASNIWSFLRSGIGDSPENLVVIGRPGSGKTTLLRHIALVLAQRKERKKYHGPRKLPVLLALRNQAEDIRNDPELTLLKVIEQSKLFRDMAEPIPIAWFAAQLKKRRFIVLLDGLDEVADPDTRACVEGWLQRQMNGRNQFIITSRPRASVERITGADRLIIQPFSWEQIRQFVQNWYLANFFAGIYRKDPQVRMDALRDAEELLGRISLSEVLKELAVNPLLLTMIATIHRYRGKLPERRVELYREIWEVFLSRRDDGPLHSGLTTSQRRCVLEPLAYSMMVGRTQEIEATEAHHAIKDILERVSPGSGPASFLQKIEESSGLLLKKENEKYEFAHKTFQEYLAAVYCSKRSENLAERVGDEWWHGAIRLYIAQADGTAVCAACLEKLNKTPAPPGVCELARACLNEAQQLEPRMREALEIALAALPPPSVSPRKIVPPLSPLRKVFPMWVKAAFGVAATLIVLTVVFWAMPRHGSSTPLPRHPRINAVFLRSGDMQTMADMASGCSSSLARYSDIGDISYQREGPLEEDADSPNQWNTALNDLETKLNGFPDGDVNYIISIGTPASMRARQRFAPKLQLHQYRLVAVGLTDPVAAGLITQPTHRNEPLAIGAVSFLQHPVDFVHVIQNLAPGRTLHYVYENRHPQNEHMANAIRNASTTHSVLITSVNHKLSVADFPDPEQVYFSWYPFEQMNGHDDILKNRIFVATRQADVFDGLAALGVAPDRAYLGQQGADLLIKDFKGEQPLGTADMRFPPRLHYWVNCQNASRLHLSFSKEVIEKADKRFGCPATGL